MANPGFPRGAPTPKVDIKSYYFFSHFFPKNCMKLKEFGPRGAGVSAPTPLDLPMEMWCESLDLHRMQARTYNTDVAIFISVRGWKNHSSDLTRFQQNKTTEIKPPSKIPKRNNYAIYRDFMPIYTMGCYLLFLLLLLLLRSVLAQEDEINGNSFTEVLKTLGRDSLGVEEIQVSTIFNNTSLDRY